MNQKRKVKRRVSGRADEIELNAQICENSMEQTEAEVKSEEKSGDSGGKMK